MRVRVSLRSKRIQKLPLNYNYMVASAIYRKIMSVRPELGLHSRQQRFKFFTFSRLFPEGFRRVVQDKLWLKDCRFLFSSPKASVVSAFVEGVLGEPEFQITNARFVVERIETLKTPEIGSEVVFRTLSPIVVRTVVDADGRRKTWDLYPSERKFYENLRKNLLGKYEDFYGTPPSGDFQVEPRGAAKLVRTQIKNTWHRGTMMSFVARGDPALLKFGYEAGFGEKNSMGFGMVEVVKGRQQTSEKRHD